MAILIQDIEVSSHTGLFKHSEYTGEQLDGRVAGLYYYPSKSRDRRMVGTFCGQ